MTRRTDVSNDGHINAAAGRPDITRLTIGGWRPDPPYLDHYTGVYVDPQHADIFRLDLTFNGLVNPPGRLVNGTFNPTQFGPTPLYGFIEFDVDRDIDTGGEIDGAATHRFLANAARFGGRPQGPTGPRAAVWGDDIDLFQHEYGELPQFERSGEDFALSFCGCYGVSIESQDGNNDSVFDPGETWVVQGRFFQRAGGYSEADFVTGGSAEGLYDPVVKLRFHADTRTPPTTTVTLVFPLTMHGAAILATTAQGGTPPDQGMNAVVLDHTSVVEALNNLTSSTRPFSNQWSEDFAHKWREGRNPADYLNPTLWNVTALIGTAYDESQPDGALYVWTDLGFDHIVADFDGDRRPTNFDLAAVQATIAGLDGSELDCDGIENGSVQICNFAKNFCLYDIDGDGAIGPIDVAYYQSVCLVNWDGQSGVDSSDFFAFIADFFNGNADFNHNGVTDSADFFLFLTAFFSGGC